MLSSLLLVLPLLAPQGELSADEKAIIALVNQAREKNNLPALTVDPTLCKAARQHTQNMARQEKMAHQLDDKGPGDRVTEAGYEWSSVRENLGEASGDADAPAPRPAEMHKNWMDSKGHRANILNDKIVHIGVSIVRSKKGTYYYTQVFAAPRK